MPEKILMPQLGESVTEGTVAKWLVNVGDQVKKYEPICEVITDKVTAEVPSSFNGTISEILVQEDETVAVGDLICLMTNSEKASSSETTTSIGNPSEGVVSINQEEEKPRFSPLVLKLAQEHNLELSMIKGSGAGGRITRKDILEFVKEQGNKQVAATVVEEVPTIDPSTVLPPKQKRDNLKTTVQENISTTTSADVSSGDQVIPVTNIRKTIANRMVESKHTSPHAWIMVECDVTNLVKYRSSIKEDFKKKEGFNLTYLPFFIKAVVESLKEFPILNSQWTGQQIVIKKEINISLAVATDQELFVPVIKDADQKSIYGLAKTINQLATKTKEKKLTMEDMSGGTFTVNNTGSFGSVLSNPIINQPQAAILSVEAIVKRPVVINDMIAVRDMMNICLSLDHRILDGLVCGRFLDSVKQKIESYGSDTKIY
ncbi:dihydrolipoamide acetyltransferase family protein [Alkalihalobacterium alkalinitrilicum]|uniref:dihydrolipoamide acetyltransferase family protein n=1 Tax=Alkalihalobacterium alkalinitrilicum TaxID=427920 RepID=UPI00114F5C44|nr:dihydrolipoamide acetyltransferase family protein [Alkalihalobacterium alkalinitrilicum]